MNDFSVLTRGRRIALIVHVLSATTIRPEEDQNLYSLEAVLRPKSDARERSLAL